MLANRYTATPSPENTVKVYVYEDHEMTWDGTDQSAMHIFEGTPAECDTYARERRAEVVYLTDANPFWGSWFHRKGGLWHEVPRPTFVVQSPLENQNAKKFPNRHG